MEKIYKLLKSTIKEDIDLALNLLLNKTEQKIIDFMTKYHDIKNSYSLDIILGTWYNCTYAYIQLTDDLKLCIPDTETVLRMRNKSFSHWKKISKENYLNGMY